MTELWRFSAAQLAAGFRGGAFTPVDALEACLGRIAQCQPALNHMVVVDEVNARSAAEASRRRWAQGEPLSPLDGVPVSLKDNLHAAGLPTTWGSRLFVDFVPPRDELPVGQLRKAGALFLGKTNLPEFATQGGAALRAVGAQCRGSRDIRPRRAGQCALADAVSCRSRLDVWRCRPMAGIRFVIGSGSRHLVVRRRCASKPERRP